MFDTKKNSKQIVMKLFKDLFVLNNETLIGKLLARKLLC